MKRLGLVPCLLVIGWLWLGWFGIPEGAYAQGALAPQLQEAWQAYGRQFIQTDGRVIDREADSRSISEAQAYAMWRAVLIGDQGTFERVWQWGENNLNARVRPNDSLWAWSWGKRADGSWGVLDSSVASDADLDAGIALIFAQRRWGNPEYLSMARRKLSDLWRLCTAEVLGQRILLPGEVPLFTDTDRSPERLFSGLGFAVATPDAPALATPVLQSTYKLNPSYWGPYAFRIFAQVDPDHNWNALVESSYALWEKMLVASPAGLPPDWILIDRQTGELLPIRSRPQENHYSFDAFRVWWRLALDGRYFSQSPAPQLLRRHLGFLQDRWRTQYKLEAVISTQGIPQVDYASTAHYGALYPALVIVDPQMAEEVKTKTLDSVYQAGIWESTTAYYTQNLVWMGLAAAELPPSALLAP